MGVHRSIQDTSQIHFRSKSKNSSLKRPGALGELGRVVPLSTPQIATVGFGALSLDMWKQNKYENLTVTSQGCSLSNLYPWNRNVRFLRCFYRLESIPLSLWPEACTHQICCNHCSVSACVYLHGPPPPPTLLPSGRVARHGVLCLRFVWWSGCSGETHLLPAYPQALLHLLNGHWFLRQTFCSCRLEVLYLGGNRLQSIPEQVGLMSSLQSLILCDNKLQVTSLSRRRLQILGRAARSRAGDVSHSAVVFVFQDGTPTATPLTLHKLFPR